MSGRFARGHTLSELLTVLTIGSLLLGMALPSGRQLFHHQAQSANYNRLVGMFRFAREQAVTGGYNTGICPTADGLICSRRWAGAFLIYQDKDGDKLFDPVKDSLVQLVQLPSGWGVNWRAFNSRDRIIFQPSGYTFNQNGTLEICPPHQAEQVATLVLSRLGRLRKDERAFEDSQCS